MESPETVEVVSRLHLRISNTSDNASQAQLEDANGPELEAEAVSAPDVVGDAKEVCVES